HRGVFDSDDASADDDHGLGDCWEVQNLIAIDDRSTVDRNCWRYGRPGTRRDDHELGLTIHLVVQPGHTEVLRIKKARRTTQNVYSIAREVRLCDVDLGLDDVLHAKG